MGQSSDLGSWRRARIGYDSDLEQCHGRRKGWKLLKEWATYGRVQRPDDSGSSRRRRLSTKDDGLRCIIKGMFASIGRRRDDMRSATTDTTKGSHRRQAQKRRWLNNNMTVSWRRGPSSSGYDDDEA